MTLRCSMIVAVLAVCAVWFPVSLDLQFQHRWDFQLFRTIHCWRHLLYPRHQSCRECRRSRNSGAETSIPALLRTMGANRRALTGCSSWRSHLRSSSELLWKTEDCSGWKLPGPKHWLVFLFLNSHRVAEHDALYRKLLLVALVLLVVLLLLLGIAARDWDTWPEGNLGFLRIIDK